MAHDVSATAPRPVRGREKVQAAVGAAVGRPLFWAVAIAALAAWPVVWAARSTIPPPPPVLGTLPEFRLVDQAGKPFGSRDLAGHVWVASFIFTRCDGECPAITSQMVRIERRARNLEPAFHLVSISVDPGFDTPARLAEYARTWRASPRMWTFLTGPSDAVRKTVVEGLKVSVQGGPDAASPDAISHGTHLVLVDRLGRIRGYYPSDAPDAVDRVVRDAALLVDRE